MSVSSFFFPRLCSAAIFRMTSFFELTPPAQPAGPFTPCPAGAMRGTSGTPRGYLYTSPRDGRPTRGPCRRPFPRGDTRSGRPQSRPAVGLWLLAEPCPSPSLAQLDRTLRALAGCLGAKYDPAIEALVGVPGTRRTTFLPAPTVKIIGWEPGRRY